jgi:hypothetical protein
VQAAGTLGALDYANTVIKVLEYRENTIHLANIGVRGESKALL